MVNGVLLLHKPVGMTSHDCVMKIRKLLKTKKSDTRERSILRYQVCFRFV